MQLARVRAALLLSCISGAAFAQDARQQVDIHGFYYKETSTRVVQPRVELTAELPRTGGGTVRASYLLDAITSASIAAGAARDATLTEVRNDVGLSLRQPVGPVALMAHYTRSRESDYDSDTVGGAVSLDLFEKNTTWVLGYFHTFDRVFNRVRRVQEGQLGTDVLSLYVTQLLSPTTVGSLGAEYSYGNGYHQNPYRGVNVGGGLVTEVDPLIRNRYTLAGRLAHLFPSTGTTLQAHYRYYFDDWNLDAHTVEARLYQELGERWDGRIAYRAYTQGAASFAKSSYVTNPGNPARADQVFTSDPKLFAFGSHYVELQLRLALSGIGKVRALEWLDAGILDLTVGLLYMGSRFGNCGPLDPTSWCQNRVIALGLTLPL